MAAETVPATESPVDRGFPPPSVPRRTALRELALVFLRLGCITFGGPAAHIALYEEELVRRRRWLTHEQFLDLLGAVNLIPGPKSTEIVLFVGYLRARWLGLVVAGTCFIFPAAGLTMILAWAYLRYGKLPAAEGLLYGIKPVIMAVVVQALFKLAPKAARTWPLALVAWGAALLALLKVHELEVLFGAGVMVCLGRGTLRWARLNKDSVPLLLASAPVLAAAAVPFSLGALFLFFLKVGAVLYGSGYVLLAFLQADLVDRYGWMTSAELLDAVAAGQVTPGPVFSTATFIGYILADKYGSNGPLGAVVATVGIFLPAYVFVALCVPLLARWRRSVTAGAFLDGLNAASLALMAVVSWQLGKGSLVDLPTVLLALASGVLLLRYRVNSLFLILGGAALGLLWHLAGLDLVGT